MSEKLHTIQSITQLLETNDKAVDRAITRIYDNLDFLYPRYRNTLSWPQTNRIKNFSWFVRGQDSKGNVRWEPKSLAHPIADRQLRKFLRKDKTCIEEARIISLMFVDYLTDIANNKFENDKKKLDSSSLPGHIVIARPSQKRYGDRYEHDAYLKTLGKKLPESEWPVSYAVEKKTIESIIFLQESWKRDNKYPQLCDVDPQHIIDRYDFWKKTHSYLD